MEKILKGFESMSIEKKIKYIRANTTVEESLIQIAEECNELSGAILKFIRKKYGSPTPKTDDEIVLDIIEELTDVIICLEVGGGLFFNEDIYKKKIKRWSNRLKGGEKWIDKKN